MKKKIIKTFDLFCGGGGSSHGAVLAGAHPVGALDMWKPATATYQLNFPTAKTFLRKADSISNKQLKGEIGKIDLLIASPECRNHSVAKGNRPIDEDSRGTAFEVIRFAKILKPRWLVVENVIQMKKWHRFEEWIHALEDEGFKIESGILDSQFFDTPQSRRRLFIVGDKKKCPELPILNSRTNKTVHEILKDGPNSYAFSPLKKPNRALATLERAERAISELGGGLPFIMVYYGSDGAGGFQTMNRPLRTVTTVDRFAFVRPNGIGYEMRMLQPPELAAAMGFSGDYLWPKTTRRNKIKLIGNAVCPLVMKAIVETLVL